MARKRFDWIRKLAALFLVVGGFTVGIIGFGMAIQYGHWWGWLLIPVMPIAIWTGLAITPEGGTTGYFDQNI